MYFQLKDQDHFNMSIDKNKKKVLKVFPDAYVDYGSEGIRIMSGDTFIAQEYFMPNTHDESKAWEYASIACRVTQNFNRTHPLRMDLSAIESKIHRINSRKRRGRKNAR